MQWIIENWLLALVGVLLVGMHLSGHRHGHGRKRDHDTFDHGTSKTFEGPNRRETKLLKDDQNV